MTLYIDAIYKLLGTYFIQLLVSQTQISTNVGVYYLLKGIFCSSAFTTFCILESLVSTGVGYEGFHCWKYAQMETEKAMERSDEAGYEETDGSDQGDAKGRNK